MAAGADGPWELYDLRTDRAESNDLAEKQPEKRHELEKIYEEKLEQYRRLARREAKADK